MKCDVNTQTRKWNFFFSFSIWWVYSYQFVALHGMVYFFVARFKFYCLIFAHILNTKSEMHAHENKHERESIDRCISVNLYTLYIGICFSLLFFFYASSFSTSLKSIDEWIRDTRALQQMNTRIKFMIHILWIDNTMKSKWSLTLKSIYHKKNTSFYSPFSLIYFAASR